MKRIFALFCLSILLIACNSESDKNKKPKENHKNNNIVAKDSLYILATDDFFETSLSNSLSQSFLEDSEIKLIWENGGSKKELIDCLAEVDYHNYPDLVLGLSNVFVTEIDSLDMFQNIGNFYFSKVRSDNKIPRHKNLLPYEFSFLTLIGKTKDSLDFPISFAELQLEKFYDKLILCDAIDTEIGRASFLNIVGIFKFHGYSSCFKMIKSSIDKIKSNENEAIKHFLEKPNRLIYTSISEVLKLDNGNNLLKFKYFPEGSFKIIHSAGITKHTKKQDSCEKFLVFLHKTEIQEAISTATKHYPVNASAKRHESFRRLNFPDKYVNSKVKQWVVDKHLADWIEYWKKYRRGYNE